MISYIAFSLEKIKDFLSTFAAYPASGDGSVKSKKPRKEAKYKNQVLQIAQRERVNLRVDIDDVASFDEELAEAIQANGKRFVYLLSDAVEQMIDEIRKDLNLEIPARDTLDIYIEHRILAETRNHPEGPEGEVAREAANKYPEQLMRRFEVYFNASKERIPPISVRDAKAEYIGKLITIKGIVTRTTEVKPMITVATYTCDQCGAETYQPISGPSFVPLERCVSNECKTNKSNGRLYLQNRGSRFMKFQEIKVQEHSDQVPTGSIPRSISIVANGEQTRKAQPGDHVLITGIFLPVAKVSGFKQLTGGLLSETYIEAHEIAKVNKTEDEAGALDDQTILDQIHNLHKSENCYDRLSSSIAPEIYGHEDLKKALLLLLIGGVDTSPYGMKIRGNINICLMGDPGVAKSQLLSFIDRLSPRSQYTTGRGSSGVGLTAAVIRDPVTDEYVLEGGALVLADLGICCIDEFDKMNEYDRTAIHEVMEQQTISIAKAGIMTSLNARVSILAAANPAYGKYNPKKSIEANIQLPAALLSRFDLLWLISDRADKESDLRLAKHITYVHQNSKNPPIFYDSHGRQNTEQTDDDERIEPVDMRLIRKYVELAKAKNPIIPEALSEHLVEAYIEMRQGSRNLLGDGADTGTFTSARTLLALIRISTALARLRFGDVVERGDVDEALRLIGMSKESLIAAARAHEAESAKTADARAAAAADKLRALMKSIAKANNSRTISMSDLIEKAVTRGFSQETIDEVVKECEEFNFVSLNEDRTLITLV